MCKMRVKIVGMVVINSKDCVTGAAVMESAAEKDGKEMVVMEILAVMVINVY